VSIVDLDVGEELSATDIHLCKNIRELYVRCYASFRYAESLIDLIHT
jgi:hypothetical protein